MPHKAVVRPGDVFWLDDVPSYKGGEPKRRPAIVVLEYGEDVVVVGVTTDRSDPTRIDLPDTATEPGAPTGLKERCCAIPRWTMTVSRDKFIEANRLGRLPAVTRERLLDAVDRAVEEDFDRPAGPSDPE